MFDHDMSDEERYQHLADMDPVRREQVKEGVRIAFFMLMKETVKNIRILNRFDLVALEVDELFQETVSKLARVMDEAEVLAGASLLLEEASDG